MSTISEPSFLKPNLPQHVLNEDGIKLKEKLYHDLEAVEKELSVDMDERDAFFRLNRKVNIQVHDLLQQLRNGYVINYETTMADLDQSVLKLLEMIRQDVCEREFRLSFLMEKVITTKLIYHFYQTGQLLPISALKSPIPTDSEYLSGVINFTAELSRYTINRACQLDFPSIKLTKELISETYQILLEFDFRNGPLRRKFDTVKYSLKTVENIFYELNLQNNIDAEKKQPSLSNLDEERSDEQIAKKPRINPEEITQSKGTDKKYQYLSEEEFRLIIQRMNEYDQAREYIIKESRDIQKAAKQAIYAVIRNQLGDAKNKLDFCKKKGEKLAAEVIHKYPTLRQGSYANSLEEYAEGELLYGWIHSQVLLTKSDLPLLNISEYVNGLADFTGEIGRLAVMYASDRKLPPVRLIQQLDLVIYDYITKLNILNNNNYAKKLDMIYTNSKKVDDIIYELVLLEKNGKLYRLMPVIETEKNEKGNADDNDI